MEDIQYESLKYFHKRLWYPHSPSKIPRLVLQGKLKRLWDLPLQISSLQKHPNLLLLIWLSLNYQMIHSEILDGYVCQAKIVIKNVKNTLSLRLSSSETCFNWRWITRRYTKKVRKITWVRNTPQMRSNTMLKENSMDSHIKSIQTSLKKYGNVLRVLRQKKGRPGNLRHEWRQIYS